MTDRLACYTDKTRLSSIKLIQARLYLEDGSGFFVFKKYDAYGS